MTGDHDHRPDTPHPADGDQGAVAPGWPPPDWPVVICDPADTGDQSPEGGRWATTYLPVRVDVVSVFVPDWYSGRTDHLAAIAVALDDTDAGGGYSDRERYRAIAFGYETAIGGNPPPVDDNDHRAHIAGALSAVPGAECLGDPQAVVALADHLLAGRLAPLLDADTPQGIADRLRRTADTNNIYGRPAEGDTNTEGGR